MEISFVIPVYNGEITVAHCINSIQKWNMMQKIEILIINDGSTDGTLQLCESIAEADKRVKVYSICNCGQGNARNYGMKQSTGKYLYFVDADDQVDAEEIFHMWEIAEKENADVVMGGYFRVNGTQRERVHLPGEGVLSRSGNTEEQALYHKVKTESAFGYVWNKLYKKEFLDKNNLQMDDIRKVYMEDQLFNLKLWSKNPIWYCYDKPVYFYEIGNVSTTRKAEPQIHIKNVAMISELVTYLKKNGDLEDNLDVVIPLVMRTFCWSLVKNIAYEGRGTKNIRERAGAYIKSGEIQQVIRMRGAVGTLFHLPSFLQAVFYMICLLLIRLKWTGCIALMFSWAYPFMKKYVQRVLK